MVFGNPEIPLGFHRNIVRTVLRARSVPRHVHAEVSEIPRVARPHPVVDVAAVLADGFRWGIHNTHILIPFVHKKDVLLPVVHRSHRGQNIVPAFFDFLGHLRDFLIDLLIPFHRVFHALARFQNLLGHILQILENRGGRSDGLQFLGTIHGQEPILDVVLLF